MKLYLGFDFQNRIDVSVLAGSDYNDSISGIGIKRAIKLLYNQVTLKNVINKLKCDLKYSSRVP